MSKRGGRSTNQAAPTLPREPNQKRGRENDRGRAKKKMRLKSIPSKEYLFASNHP